MRLDHLLSRENVEGETRRHILRSIKYSNVFVRDRQERLPKEPLGSNVLRFLLCIVFRVREKRFGGLAQLGERLPCKQEVSGSIPLISTTYGLLAQLVRALA